MIKVAVDAMGGDNAPVEMVAGAVEAVKIRPEIHVLLEDKTGNSCSLSRAGKGNRSRAFQIYI